MSILLWWKRSTRERIHIVEPELGQVVRDVVQSGKLRAVCKPEAADAFFIVVPTPFKQNHRADITYVGSGHPFRDPLSAGG